MAHSPVKRVRRGMRKTVPRRRRPFPTRRRRAAFLDRDGVIIDDVDYLRHPGQMRFIPGAARAIARLKAAGYKTVVVSNQSGVARGFLSRNALERIHALMRRKLLRRGARLDSIYYCPHHPLAGRRVKCRCRKPGIGMLESAARRHHLDLKACVLVGDKTVDVRTARNAGCAAVLVRTGKGGKDGLYADRPDAVCRDLSAAAGWILRNLADRSAKPAAAKKHRKGSRGRR